MQLAWEGNVVLRVATITRKMDINVTTAMQANKMGIADKTTPTPKKRGRPRKKFLNLADRSSNPYELKDRSMKGDSNNPETSVKVTPKKRGRPRKKFLNLADRTINPYKLKDKSMKGYSGGEENSGAKDINCNSKRIRKAKVIFSPTRMKSDHKELPVTSSCQC